MKKTSYMPNGYHNVIPSLSFKDTQTAIDWYTNVVRAKEKMRVKGHDEKIMHAELSIGDSVIFLADENPKYNNIGPSHTNGNSVVLHTYVEDVDEVINKAVQ